MSATQVCFPEVLKSKTAPVIVAGALIMSTALGVRQTFGLFVDPFSFHHGLPVTLVAFAIAFHNLVWGFTQPFAGAAADRHGSAPVVAFGAVSFAAGLVIAAVSHSAALFVFGMGVLVGIGISCTSFGVVMAAVGRTAAPRKRSMAMGLANAGGSLGQIVLVPLAQGTTAAWGLSGALFVLALFLAMAAPLGIVLDRRDDGAAVQPERRAGSLGTVLIEALRHRGYRLLSLGFFACGFQLAFIATYLPGYLSLCHMPIGLGATALVLIGTFNVAGSWACGWLGGRFRQQYVLGWLYLIRGAAVAAFFLVPKTNLAIIAFAVVMGLVWLGTVPLTSGYIAKIFGATHLGTLFGVCFMSHQIGSFLGAWSGGIVFDITGSYQWVWVLTAMAGFVAALLNFLIDDRIGRTPTVATLAQAYSETTP